jgi:xanthine dehydrogenase YagS FAD-binding subunit
MQPFAYHAVQSVDDARAALLEHPQAALIAGGTTLIDQKKADELHPAVVVDISRLPLTSIDVSPDRVRIGALARNSDVADDATIAREFPVLAQALAAGASGQLRNMATVGGNLLQRTRCSYFRDPLARCNKREPGAGCDALEGYHRAHAVLGTSDACIATHPSDMTAALAALDARIVVARTDGDHRFALDDFYRMPGEEPERETVLERGDVIVGVEIATAPLHRNSLYLKLRDRASYAFALASVAAALEIAPDGSIAGARIALGGVATVPWRARAAERVLVGAAPDDATFARAATAAVDGALPRRDNAFKVDLAQRAVRRALRLLAEAARR